MSDPRSMAYGFLNRMIAAPESALSGLAEAHLTADSVWDLAFPINRLAGREAVLEGFLLPLRNALAGARRRDEIFIGGENRCQPGSWVAAVTHYVGNFREPLLGIAPSDRLAFLRSGEFYRLEEGRIAEAKLILDFPDLMRQAGRFPLPRMLGTEMLFPGPASHDGVLPANRPQGAASLDLVEAMLGDLHHYDPETFQSKDQTGAEGYWHDDMLWYGPGGIGANYTWAGFAKDHRLAFLKAFPDRKGGNHFCHIGDGDYAAVSGWPSMTMTHRGDYLGVPATNKALTLRVMDFYRCAGGKIMENWVLLDYLDLFDQMGVDLIARAGEMP
ncbi:ester cyclase [Pelagibius sp.]|uniref:nuclear transport factor 2 family protein n=1 Tax=Pelagibius sp. TaxID=1931238 RepID=UPI002634760B|nr:ester cyclase [Pelagibius sp.]